MTDADTLAQLWSENLPLRVIGSAFLAALSPVGPIAPARPATNVFQSRLPTPLRPRSRKRKPADMPVVERCAPAPVEERRAPRLLIDLGWQACRWPVGAVKDERHLFCGQPQAPGVDTAPSAAARSGVLRPSVYLDRLVAHRRRFD